MHFLQQKMAWGNSKVENYQLRAGAGKANIEIPVEFFPQENFSGNHDDINVRIVILECDKSIALVSLELTSLPESEVKLLKILVNSLTGILPDDIWICVTHSFSSPHFLPPFMLKDEGARQKVDLLRQAIHEAVHKAADCAVQQMKDAQIGFKSGECNVNVNRDVLTNKGWWIGSNLEGVSDKTLTVLRIDEKDGAITDNPIAILFNYNVQSSVMDGSTMEDGTKKITSDLVGKASDFVETIYERRTVAMFLIGAAGDQAPIKKAKNVEVDMAGDLQERDLQEEGYAFVTDLGEILGKETVRIAKEIKWMNSTRIMTGEKEFLCPGQKMTSDIHNLHPTFTYEYLSDEDREMSVEAIKIGEIVLLGTRPELNDQTSRELKRGSLFSQTLVITMVNGASKYMADKESYDKVTYESMNSPFGKGSAEILTENAIALLNQMKNQI